ncbi:hypothetical protein Pmani_039867 [Petrolisthes manimaculis]|uniref:Uncharacterized protein n=1 Tax=Petrolisthes manimaculis TaxID=1843537 RepID=A0AAE1NCV8_9EUCA|nr:hypothetical protein Pmani_039867 [Petrolisthes manimaculis]
MSPGTRGNWTWLACTCRKKMRTARVALVEPPIEERERRVWVLGISFPYIPERPHALTCAPHLPRIPCIPVSFTLHIPRLHNGGQKRACVGMKEARAKRGKGLAG